MDWRKKRNERASLRRNKQQQLAGDEYQPKILKKPETPKIQAKIVLNLAENDRENEQNKSSALEDVKVEPPTMKHSVCLISKNHVDCVLLKENLDLENSNFYVVGAIGMKDAGKSTLLNLIATAGEPDLCEVKGKSSLHAPLFSDFPNGNGVEGFITKNRVILLDSAPVLYNIRRREFIVSEADDIRQVQSLLRLCHELVIVYESHQIMNLLRMLICAKNTMNPYESDEPIITLIENRVRLGSSKNPMTEPAVSVLRKSNISDSINSIQVLNFTSDHNEMMATINKLRDDINTRKERKACADPTETEKTWWEKFSKMNTNDDGLLLAQFENMREKYYQESEY